MAKPLRHSRSDRFRNRVPIAFPLRVGALLRQRQAVSLLLIQKTILAASALRRCVELETWIAETMQSLEGFPVSSGVCMCGDEMEGHAGVLTCGHSPVDSGDYYLSELTKQAAQLLAKPMADAPGDKPYSYLQMQQRINHGEWQLKQSDKVIENLRERLAAAEKVEPGYDVSFLGRRPLGATHFLVRLPLYRSGGKTEACVLWFRFNAEKAEWEYRSADSDGNEYWGSVLRSFSKFPFDRLLPIKQESENVPQENP